MKSLTLILANGRRLTVYPEKGKLEVRTKLTPRQKRCAAKFIREEMHELAKGRWASREQAIAVGLSRARKAC